MKAERLENLIKQNQKLKKAFDLAQQIHKNQKRRNGEPYFNHVLATAERIAEWKLDETSIIAALLHDSLKEEVNYPLEKIKDNFGEDVAFLVESVNKLSKIKYHGSEQQVENLRKMLLVLSQNLRVVIIKLADRLHNMETLSALPPQKQKAIALETSELYAPLAYRLGMHWVSGKLEDLAFPYLHPKEYRWLLDNVKDKYGERENYIEKAKPALEKILNSSGIKVLSIDSRAKRYSSLYKKLLRCDMDIEKVHDLVALRIIVENIEDCYAALGVIHAHWPPLPNKIKDYIALPKPNGYRSLHTTVFFVDNKITEIQIRTKEMHEEAEAGVAAHWSYQLSKNTENYLSESAHMPTVQIRVNNNNQTNSKESQWVNRLKDWQKDFSSPEEFLESLKIDFLKDRIFVLTPKGEVVDLPTGSTPVDFAYQIHSGVGNSCSGAKVNGKIVALDQPLISGDLVEILIQKNKKPSESWLDFVKTANAKNHIKNGLKNSDKKLVSTEPKASEIKITVEDHVGLLKEISAIFSRSHTNIISVNTLVNARFPVLKFKCDLTNRVQIEKIMLKIKALKAVREISYILI